MISKLSDIVDLIGGGTPKTSVDEYWGGDIPWLSVKDFNNDSRYVYSTEKTITEAGLENSSTKMLDVDDIIISARGTVGELAMIPFPMAFNQSCYGIRGKKGKVIQTYLYYLLKNSIRLLKSQTHGSVFDTITRDTFASIEVDLPSLEDQHKIADTLSSLDNKIDNNRKINHHLEQMAQAIFKTWFVDFEPWGGVMPDDWRKIQLAEIVETVNGYTYKSSELVDSTTAMATIKNFERGGGFKLEGFKEILPSSKIKPSQYVNLYETIVAHTDLTQKAEVIGNAEMLLSKAGYELIVASMDLVKVLPATEGLSKFVLGAILKSPLFKEHCLGYTNGTTVLHLSKRAIPEFLLYFPQNIEILNTLNDLLEPLYLQMSLNIDESARLVLLRDTLLHRLMSGELSVAELGGAK